LSEDGHRPRIGDAPLYAASACGAALVWLLASIPQYREWARLALGLYAAGALVALVVRRRSAGTMWLTVIAIAVFAGVALIPMALEVTWRAHTGPGFHAQSEAIITEEAARALVHGKDPYATTYVNGPLTARPLGTKTHFPYLPGMLAFGLPRALSGSAPAPVADARIPFALVALTAGGAALRLARWGSTRRLRLFQALFVLPTTALLMATGGDDVPVVALMILSLALLDHERPVVAGIALGVAAAMKQTAWVLLPFLAVAAAGRQGDRQGSPLASVGSAVGVAAAAIGPFVLWNPGAFVEDAILFPLGLGHQESAAGTPTVGSALVRALPSIHGLITIALVVVVAAVAAYLLIRRPPRTPARAALQAGSVFALAIVLAPAARTGYAIYPVCLVAWGLLARSARPSARSRDDPESEPAPGPSGAGNVSPLGGHTIHTNG
jgi:hypothetical protein